MKEKEDQLTELYRKVLNGTARTGDKERLAHWMAGLDIKREDISPEELAEEQEQSQLKLRSRFFHQQKSTPAFRPWRIAASIAAVLFSTILFIRIHSGKGEKQPAIAYIEINTKAGERKTLILQDGSKILMNNASQIRYPASFTGKTREVYLEGQAYFEVKHDNIHPFLVHSGRLDIQVLGTTFDVRNYKADTEASITVATGKVAVQTPAAADPHMLTPGGQLTYDKKTGMAAEHTVALAEYFAWQKGAQVFRNKELREVGRLLERAYGVTIKIRTPELEAKKVNLRIKGSENITQVMKMLSVIADFHYSVKDRTIILWK